LPAHLYSVSACYLSPDGRRLFSGSNDQVLNLWDAENYVPFAQSHPELVLATKFLPGGKEVASVSSGCFALWDTETCLSKQIFLTDIGAKVVGAHVIVTKAGKVVVRANDDIFVWNVTSNDLVKIPTKNNHKRGYCVTPDGKQIISCCETINIYDVDTGEIITSFGDCRLEVVLEMACAVTPDGSKLVAISDVYTVWDLKKQERIVFAGFSEQCMALQIMPDGKHVLAENDAYTLMILDLATGKILHGLSFDAIVTELAVLENGTVVVVHAQKLHYFTPNLVHIETYAFDEPIAYMGIHGKKYCFGCTNGRVLFRTREDGEGERLNSAGDNKWQLGFSPISVKAANVNSNKAFKLLKPKQRKARRDQYHQWLTFSQA